jgi:putative MFS transporter
VTASPPAENPASTATPLELRVGEALDSLRSFRASWWAPILLGLIMLFDSWDAIAIAYVMPSIAKEWALGPTAMGALISSGYVGQFFGAILLSALAERVGRMPVFLATVAAMGLLAIASAAAPDYPTMMVLRVVQGLAIGGALPVAVTYINELAPSATRGRYFSIFQFLYLGGYALASVASTVIVPYFGWRWLLGVGAIPLALLPLVMLTLPESPRWLAQRGRAGKLPAAFTKLGGALPASDLPASGPSARQPRTLSAWSLFAPKYRWLTLTLVAQWFLTSFVNLGMTTWIPSIYVTVYKIPVADALLYASVASIGFKVMIPIMAILIDRYGRRPLPIVGTFLGAAILLTLAFVDFADVHLLVAIVIAGMLSFQISSFMVWPYSAEIYPTYIRAVGLGLCSATARGASMLTPLLVGVILGNGGSINIVYGVFGLFAVGSFLLWTFTTTETAGRTLETI